MKKAVALALLVFVSLTACNKAVVRGKERPTLPLSRTFSAPVPNVYEAAKQALAAAGYEIRETDETRGLIRTAWIGTQAASHYTELFGQHDYGTVGAYYRLEVRVSEKDGKSEIKVSAPVKSLVAHQKSTGREERKVLKKIADLLRRENFEMTNVGTE